MHQGGSKQSRRPYTINARGIATRSYRGTSAVATMAHKRLVGRMHATTEVKEHLGAPPPRAGRARGGPTTGPEAQGPKANHRGEHVNLIGARFQSGDGTSSGPNGFRSRPPMSENFKEFPENGASESHGDTTAVSMVPPKSD